MTYALMYIENADIVGMYESRDAALADLATMVNERPDLRDEVGLCPYEDGYPVGDFQSASELLASQLDQQQLDIAPTHGQ